VTCRIDRKSTVRLEATRSSRIHSGTASSQPYILDKGIDGKGTISCSPFHHTSMSSTAETMNALEKLTATLSNAVHLLNDIPSPEKFSKEDRSNAVAILARIFPEQLRAPANSVTNDKARGGADDDGCAGVTPERKYYAFDSVHIKRTLEPHEFVYNIRNELAVPLMTKERMMNDFASIEFVRRNTSIPLPKVLAAFHDNGRYYIIQERVPGVHLADMASSPRRWAAYRASSVFRIV